MSFYDGAVRDERVREYVPVKRVLWESGCRNAGAFVGRMELQPEYGSETVRPEIREGGGILLDFGIELHGGIRLVNSSGRGVRIRLRFGESASEAMGTPDQDHAIHDAVLELPTGGMLEYGNTAFRFVRIDAVHEPLVLLNVIAVAQFLDLEYAGSFESSDERLNRIWKTAAYTLHLNMQDYIYDGVKRDRLVWMGDLNPEVRGILAVFRETALIPKSLDFLRDHTALPKMMNGITSYSFWWVITLYDYYLHSGDLDWLREQRDYLTALLPILCSYTDENGKEQVPPYRFLDWPTSDNAAALHAGLQGLLFWTLNCGIELGRILDFDTSEVRKTVARMAACVPDCGDSKAAAAIQTVSGLADRSDVVLRDPFRGVSTFYGYYMLRAQPVRNALELIRRYWGAMLDYGATTFWEDFNLDWVRNASPVSELPVPGKDDLHADFGDYCYKGLRHSLCHGWACGPAPFLSERVLGVRILAPGCRKLSIRPELAGLDFVRGTFPTPHGLIRVEADKSGKLDIAAPSGVELV